MEKVEKWPIRQTLTHLCYLRDLNKERKRHADSIKYR